MIDNGEKKDSYLSVKKFFFPFSPIKSFRTLQLIFFLAILIALRIVLGLLTIRIAPFSLSISLAWLPLMVIGWYFGPIVGLVFGAITDTIGFLLPEGGIWFWMYAIQEPIIGLLSGLVGSVCRIRKSSKTNKITIDIIINQVMVIGFAIISSFALIYWLDPLHPYRDLDPEYEKFYQIYRWIILSGIMLLLVVYEVITGFTLAKKKNNNSHHLMINFIYASCLVIVSMLIFSIALGPITAVEYLKFIDKSLPEQYLKYGSIFYLVPRICVEAVKIPLESSCLFGIVCLCDREVMKLINRVNNSWQQA